MTSTSDFLERARRAAANVSFKDLCLLVEKAGYTLARQKGSHRIYVNEGRADLPIINLQRDGKMAKPYQVRQVLRIIEENSLLEE